MCDERSCASGRGRARLEGAMMGVVEGERYGVTGKTEFGGAGVG